VQRNQAADPLLQGSGAGTNSIQAVPEPNTCAMLLIGAAVIAMQVKRKRTKNQKASGKFGATPVQNGKADYYFHGFAKISLFSRGAAIKTCPSEKPWIETMHLQIHNFMKKAMRFLHLPSLAKLAVLVFSGALFVGQSAQATGETDWKNTSTTWSTAGSWTVVSGSAPPAPGDVAWFTATEAFNPSLASTSPNIAGLYFSTTGSSGYSFTRTSGAFTLTGSATSIGVETSNATAVAIGANNTSGVNSIAVPITLAPASGSTSTFFQAAGGQLTLTSTTVISGTGILLNLTGGGTMSFASTSIYDGGTKIAGPTVINAQATTPFGTGTLELNSGTLKNSTTSTNRTLANVVSITGDFTFDSGGSGALNVFTGGASTTGDRIVTVNTATTRFDTNPVTLGGNLTTAGTSRLNITSGINLGGADRTITYGAALSGTFNGAVDSSASGNKLVLAGNNLTMNGITAGATNVVNFDVNAPAGTMTFSGTNTFLGSVTVDAGTLNATSDSALGSSTAATAGLAMTPSSGTATVNFTSSTPAIASLASSGAGTSKVVLGNAGASSATTLSVGGNNASTTFAGTISDNTATNAAAIGNFTKTGTGTLTLSGANTYTGTTTVSGGTLSVTGSISSSSAVSVSGGATLSGSGTVGAVAVTGTLAGTLHTGLISGSGIVAPGNSPGITTSASADLSGGLDFKFELTGTNPTYNNATASVNDVLHLTGGNPFNSTTATSANVFSIYLGVTALSAGVFNGGIFANGGDFASTVANGTYNYFVKTLGSGSSSYNSNNYITLAEYNAGSGTSFTISNTTLSVTGAGFSEGSANGYEQQFVVAIPEPGTYAMALGGFGMLMAIQRMRRRRS
jgi:autotransporter-associated beta strand protein